MKKGPTSTNSTFLAWQAWAALPTLLLTAHSSWLPPPVHTWGLRKSSSLITFTTAFVYITIFQYKTNYFCFSKYVARVSASFPHRSVYYQKQVQGLESADTLPRALTDQKISTVVGFRSLTRDVLHTGEVRKLWVTLSSKAQSMTNHFYNTNLPKASSHALDQQSPQENITGSTLPTLVPLLLVADLRQDILSFVSW